jgi:hypothetical protein
MRYFKRAGSEVIERMSSDRTAIPNTQWKEAQLTLHGFTEVFDYVEPPEYSPSAFKLACIADPIVSSVIMKAPAALIDAINAGNFGMVKAGIDYMVNEGMATVEQRVAFVEILIANNGQDLTEGEQE